MEHKMCNLAAFRIIIKNMIQFVCSCFSFTSAKQNIVRVMRTIFFLWRRQGRYFSQ